MLGIRDLALFIVSGLVLNIAPGPDSLLIASRSAAQGWRAGSAAALGVGSGVLVHVLAAALGLSALIAASASAFAMLKLAGAVYLVYVGYGLLRGTRATGAADAGSAAGAAGGAAAAPLPLRRIYAQGFWTNVLNPKVAMFFLAFVPQFIAPDAASKPLAFIVLGAVFDFNAMLWCHLLAVSTALASRRLRTRRWIARAAGQVVGGLFVALGVRLALAGRH